ncbi:hypothetical protein DAPPUDRAFT_314542 [Daphnia pulex]|uniref:Uncharacterized protein n=1 Tax=Daphnia pulex TaxID=6669 RepID=E9G6H7_DAPPU|nr:hypothetical protein DAPPUDRAFT_314542 [Daphnia pulex]|eukprot:EFX84991.1 hypothetical protein DAPPUDRAFT_314542 [Daphnia pulex]
MRSAFSTSVSDSRLLTQYRIYCYLYVSMAIDVRLLMKMLPNEEMVKGVL